MSRFWVVVRWTPVLVVCVVCIITWILLPYVWSDLKQDWREAR